MSSGAFGRLVRLGLRGRRLLGTLLFVGVVALASAAFVSGLESRQDAGRLWDDAFDRALGPHVRLGAPDAETLVAASAYPSVIARSDPVTEVDDVVLVRPDEVLDVALRGATASVPADVGAPYVTEGRLAVEGSEVAVESSFAADLGIEIGDRLELRHGSTTATFDVVGTILDFNDCFYPQCDPGVVWTVPAGLERVGPGDRWQQVYLRLDDPASAPSFVAQVLRDHGDSITSSQDWIDTRGDALTINEFFGAFLAGFGVFVLIAAGIVVAGSVTNRVLARRRDIGLLKAVGVTPAQVVGAITVEHLVLAAAAVLLGWLAGSALVPAMRIGVTEILEPGGMSLTAGSLIATAVVVAVIVLIATVLPASGAARRSTAETLRPAGNAGRRSWPARLATALGGGPVTVGGVKDIVQRPLRTALAVLSVVLAIVALVIVLGFGATVDMATDHPAVVGDPWDVAVVPPEGVDQEQFADAIDGTPGVAGWFWEAESRRVVDGDVVLARAVGGDPEAARYVIREGRNMVAAGEGIAGYGLLERLGRSVGDTVTVEIEGARLEVQIVGRYSEVEDAGDVLQFRWESLEGVVAGAEPSMYRVVAAPDTDRGELAAALQATLGPDVTVQPLVTETDDLDAFGVAFWLVAGLVLVVALANLGATVLLGVRERMRDLGVLRAIGFTPHQLVASGAVGTLVIVAIAAVIGVPLGLWLNRSLLTGVGRAMGAGPEFRADPALVPTTVVVLAVVVVAVAIGALTCVQSSRKPVSELVRYE
ncbi:MAG: ABC transporter permease [Acidimicrobiia bacterium]